MPGLKIRNNKGEEITVQDDAVQKLNASVRGELIGPQEAGYEQARKVYNAMHDRRPVLIVRVSGVADVIAVIKFAAQHDLYLAVRGGGHSVPGFGTCDDGLVLDLGKMKGIRVDQERSTARAEGGCTWGDFNHATYAFGMATTGGIVSTTGIAGLTLGGGLGYLERQYGLSCDNLISADVVLADGAFVTCSAEREPELFWAIRGGGGNFGVVTSFEFRLHRVSDIFGGPTFFPLDGNVVRNYQHFIKQAPEELGLIFAFTMGPPLPFLPPKWHGKPVCAVLACWTGAIEDGEKVLAPLREWGEVAGAYLGPMPYPVLNTLFDDLLPAGLQQYWKGNFVRELLDDAIEAHLEHAARVPSIQSGTFFFPINGACQRVRPDATAFAYRDATFATIISGAWHHRDENEKNIAWVRQYYEAIRPYGEEGAYVNFLSDDDQNRVGVSYGRNYRRLVELKTKYDPKNLFQVNQNIQPRVRQVL